MTAGVLRASGTHGGVQRVQDAKPISPIPFGGVLTRRHDLSILKVGGTKGSGAAVRARAGITSWGGQLRTKPGGARPRLGGQLATLGLIEVKVAGQEAGDKDRGGHVH